MIPVNYTRCKSEIIRPVVYDNFTSLPNCLFNFALHFPGLRPNDIAVLNYLLSKPTLWTIDKETIAKALNIGVWTVGNALRKLIKYGFASYQRFKDGRTKWKISVPETVLKTASSPDLKPQFEKPKLGKPQLGNHTVLESNEVLENIEKTTNAGVVIDELKIKQPDSDLPLPPQLTEPEKTAAKKALAQLPDHHLQLSVLAVLATALTTGAIKNANPIGYLKGIVKNALNGEFTAPNGNSAVSSIAAKKSRKTDTQRKIEAIVKRNKQSIQQNLEKFGFVTFVGVGSFSREQMKAYGF